MIFPSEASRSFFCKVDRLDVRIYEVVDYLLLLALLNPQDMAGIQIDDMRCKLVSVMKLEFVDRQVSRLLFWLLECFTVFGVEPLQPRFVDRFHGACTAGQSDRTSGDCELPAEQNGSHSRIL